MTSLCCISGLSNDPEIAKIILEACEEILKKEPSSLEAREQGHAAVPAKLETHFSVVVIAYQGL